MMGRIPIFVLFAILSCGASSATSVDLSKPIAEVCHEADIVAIVTIRAADAENFSLWIYKAEVTSAIKGAKRGDSIFFGAAEAYQQGTSMQYLLDGEYVVMLDRAPEPLGEMRRGRDRIWSNDDEAPIYQVMNATASIMPVALRCLDTGCEWAALLGSANFKLPSSLAAHENACDIAQEQERDLWVSKNELLEVLKVCGGPSE